MQKRVISIAILEDGKLLVSLPDNKTEYIQPPIQVDTLIGVDVLEISGKNNAREHIDITATDINGVLAPWANFAALETAVRNMAKDANQLYFGGGSASGGATELKQDDQIALATKISQQLEVGGPLTFIDLTNSQGTGWPGFPFDVDLIQWNDGTTTVGGAIAPTTVNDANELIALFNANIPNNQMEFRDTTSVYLVAGTDSVPTAGYVNIQTTTPDALFYQQGFWGTDADTVPSSPKVTAEKLTNIVNGVSTTPNIVPYTTYSTAGTIDTIVQILPANPNRSKVAVSILNGTALIVKGVPGGSVRKGIPVSSFGTWFDSVGNDGRMYRGIISVINTANGLDFDFSVTEE